MPDLALVLRTAADAATADLAPIAAPPVLGRIHRRRAVRHAAEGAVGIAAAGAVTVAGVQLVNRDDVVPAAPEPVEVTCGTDLADVEDLASSPDAPELRGFDVLPEASESVPPGRPAEPTPANRPAALFAFATAAPGAAARIGTRTTYALVLGGEVVALPAEGWADDDRRPWEGVSLWRAPHVPFATCLPDGSLGGPPAPGTYGLVAFLLPDDAADWPVPLVSDRSLLHLAEPVGADEVPPDLEALVLTLDGLGDGPTAIRLGEPPVTGHPQALLRRGANGCVLVHPGGDEAVVDAWTATYDRTAGPWSRLRPFVAHVDRDGVVRRIDVQTPGPRTDSGLEVGDTLADVRAAHPDVERLGAAAPGSVPGVELWGVVEGDRALVFQVYDGAPLPDGWQGAEAGTVLGIVLQLGTDDLALRYIC